LRVLDPTFPRVAALLRDAEADVLAYLAFPVEHWRSISSTNVLERLNAEIDRRAKVVGFFLCVPIRAGTGVWDARAAKLPEGPRVTRNLSVGPSGSDLVRASPLGSCGWPSDRIAA
jgi:hypothetical protein